MGDGRVRSGGDVEWREGEKVREVFLGLSREENTVKGRERQGG